jgi:hypothetical protein
MLMLAALFLSPDRRSVRSSQTTAIFAFVGVMAVSLVFSYRPGVAWIAFYRYCTLVVFYLVVLGTIKRESQLRGFVLVYLCTMATYQLLSLREYLFFGRGDWSGGIWRMVGYESMLAGPNAVAASIAYSLPFAFGLLKGDRRWRKCIESISPISPFYSLLP